MYNRLLQYLCKTKPWISSVVIYVETLEQTLPMSFTSPEVNFKGFGAVKDISIVGDISIEAVTDEVPHQFLQDEDLR